VTVRLQTIRAAPADSRATQAAVTTSDGVDLATAIYLPAGPHPVPTVLVRTPYDKAGRSTFLPSVAERFVAEGYAFVVQDVRGKFGSGGATLAFINEIADGYDTLEWIATQPWSNGSVGMWGDSYLGYAEWAAVASGHRALKAIVPRVTAANLADWIQRGVDALHGALYLAEAWSDDLNHTWEVDWTRRPLADVFDPGFEAIGTRSASFDDFLAHRSSRKELNPYPDAHPFERLTVPVLHCVGWFDVIAPESMLDYSHLIADSELGPLQYLVADATDHENYRLADVPIPDHLDHGQSLAAVERMLPAYLDPALEFFAVFLAETRPRTSLARVRWRLGRAGWRVSPTWPPSGARELRLYLGNANAATRDASGGVLRASPEASPASVEWEHDPDDLVPSTVENPYAFLLSCPDEGAVESRSDVLTFTSTPQEHPLDLAGPVVAHLRLTTDAPSTHVFVKLVEVAPGGHALMLLRGQVTARTEPGLLTEISLGHTGHRLGVGYSLRLHVASSDFPLYVAHPGTDENPWFAEVTRTTTQTLIVGGDEDASHIRVTIVDVGSGGEGR
jgi:putative CocE/NonD family hydrolase